jgi:hypothetical protein
LQTNIESLTVWNRDGRFIDMGTDKKVAPTAPVVTTTVPTALTDSLRSGDPITAATADAFSTNGLLFKKSAADATKPVGSFANLGLASSDSTEGGLVLHATVSDDLNGDGTIGTNEVSATSTDPIYKTNANGSQYIDATTGLPVISDYYRRYKGSSNTRQSPYAFAFNGGNNLPGALTVVSDQAIYLQGDYNNYNGGSATTSAKQPASVLADTITVLSVNCLSGDTLLDPKQIRTGQINCGVQDTTAAGTTPAATAGLQVNWTAASSKLKPQPGVMYDAEATTVNAAFLSYTDQSNGNAGTGRYDNTKIKYYSGGLNNYMRMIENWKPNDLSKTFTYSGSFISLGNPIEFSGRLFPGGFQTGSYFYPPTRTFSYDASFNNFSSLPPLTPRSVYLKQTSYNRSRN